MVLLAPKSSASSDCGENNLRTIPTTTRMISHNFKAAEKLRAKVEILQDRTKIAVGLKCTLHVDNIVQTAVVEKIVKCSQQQRAKANSVGGSSTENIFEAQLNSSNAVEQHVEKRHKPRNRVIGFLQSLRCIDLHWLN